jgi:hypothetical protein
MYLEAMLTSRYIEANAACYFVIDFSRLVPGLDLPDGASELDGETELMRRMIASKVHIVSSDQGIPLTIESHVA